MSIGDSSTPLGKVRGLGSAREGGEHWLTERVTSVALLLLGVQTRDLVGALLCLEGFKFRVSHLFECKDLPEFAGQRTYKGYCRGSRGMRYAEVIRVSQHRLIVFKHDSSGNDCIGGKSGQVA